MKTNSILFALAILFLAQCTTQVKEDKKPPVAPVKVVEEVYFGTTVADPYRYMENLEDPVVQDWFKAQADYSREVLNSIPGRQSLIDDMRDFDSRTSSSIRSLNITDNNFYFYLKTTPADETGKLFYRKGYEGAETLLFDPTTFGSDTAIKYVISGFSPSDNGGRVAFEIAEGGSESSILMIMDVKTKELFPEQIDRCWFASPSWLPDGKSFLYNRLNSSDVHDEERELNSKTFLHQVGTDPSTDRDVFSRATNPNLDIKPEDFPVAYYDKDSRHLYGYAYTVDSRIKVFYAPASEINNEKINWKPLFVQEDQVYDFETTDKDLYVYTPKNAPNFKVLKTSIANPNLETAKVVIAENPSATLTNFTLASSGIYYTQSKNGVEEKVFHQPYNSTSAKELELPFTAGTAMVRTRGYKHSDVWVIIAGWVSDYERFRYLADKNEFKLENLSSVAEFPEFDNLIAKEVMVKSHDGVMVPLSIVFNEGTEMNGKNPVLIFGYGAYGSSMNPFFWPDLLLWTKQGGVLAIAHVRGGGELGDEWHKAGQKTTKPNTWKDLIACTEYLINEKYTSPKNVAIYSASAGGILVGRAMTERPDLFAAVVPAVGCMNTLRGENSPNGPVNVPEFGTSADSVECMALIEMDSYLHLQDGEEYPATLVTAGMNDPRVIAWQPAKFAARLQAANASEAPVLFLPDYDAGHGMGDTKSKQFESLSDVLSFALWQTGAEGFQVN
jgi:prolyl oligopeptidase